MPAIVANAKNFLLNSDFPLDKVVYMAEGSFSAPNMTLSSQSVAHGLSFVPLPSGSWTNTASWVTSYEYYTGPPSSNPTTMGLTPYDVRVEADATNITVTCFNYSGSSATIRYRVYCFMPSNVSTDAPHTSSLSNDFILNTDYNYTKLYKAGIYTQPATTGIFSVSVSHDLGYRPQVISWGYLAGKMRPNINVVEARSNDILLHFNNPGNIDIHYRIYLDE